MIGMLFRFVGLIISNVLLLLIVIAGALAFMFGDKVPKDLWREPLRDLVQEITKDPQPASPMQVAEKTPAPKPSPAKPESPTAELPELPWVTVPVRPRTVIPPPGGQDEPLIRAEPGVRTDVSPASTSDQNLSDLLGVMEVLGHVGVEPSKDSRKGTR